MTTKPFDFDEMFRIQKEAERNLKTQSAGKKKKTRHRLRSVNHLSDQRSGLLSNPLTLIAEDLLKLYEFLRDSIQQLEAKLFPRNNHIYLNHINSEVIGKLTFADKEDYHTPIHHMHIEMWAKTKFRQWRKLSECHSDMDGKFSLPFDMSVIHRHRMAKKIRIEFYHTEAHLYDEHDFENTEDVRAQRINRIFKTITLKKGDLNGMSYDMGTLPLFYWEYRKDTPLPRVVIKDHDKDAPQKYPEGRTDTIAEQFIPIELTTRKHERLLKRHKDLTYEEIQQAYPENLTVAMEKLKPGITRSDQWFAERMVNGMYASTLDKDPENPDLYWLYYHWSSYAHTDDYAFNDISMKFRINDEGYFLPVSITLKGPTKPEGSPHDRVTLTPEDGEQWNAAKRVARVSGGILTEVDKHFTETHLNTEQYAIAAYRNIRKNPISEILFPHVRSVVLINHTADQILVNEDGYICRSTALKIDGLTKRVEDVFGTLDWKNWSPMKPLSDKHTYAKAANLYYQVVTDFIDVFVDKNRDEIVENWVEIFCFSRDLVRHSVNPFLCSHLQKALSANPKKGDTATLKDWYTDENRMDLELERAAHSEEHKAVSHVTLRNSLAECSEEEVNEELAHMKKACAYVIFQATFGHFWANSKQYDDIGEFRYSSLGIRLGQDPNGVLGPESDDSIMPSRLIATQMMWWSNMLSKTGYGYIMKDEQGDISPIFKRKLKAQEKAFAELGVDIYSIQSETNI